MQGQWIGLLNDVLVAAGDDMTALARDLLEKAEGRQIRADYAILRQRSRRGAGTTRWQQSLKTRFTEQEFEVVSGGQALYPYIISVE